MFPRVSLEPLKAGIFQSARSQWRERVLCFPFLRFFKGYSGSHNSLSWLSWVFAFDYNSCFDFKDWEKSITQRPFNALIILKNKCLLWLNKNKQIKQIHHCLKRSNRILFIPYLIIQGSDSKTFAHLVSNSGRTSCLVVPLHLTRWFCKLFKVYICIFIHTRRK